MIRKIFRQMLVTQILSAMTVMLCMLVDSMMIGRFLGVDSMTAYGLANPVLLIFAAYGAMLSAGIQVMCGKTMGAGDKEGTNACFSASAAAEGQAPHRKGQRYYDISADGGNSWTSQWFTEEEVLEELKAGYMLILADSRKHFQK